MVQHESPILFLVAKLASPPPASRAGFTTQQKLILLFASLLVIGWLAIAAGCLFSNGTFPAQAIFNTPRSFTARPTAFVTNNTGAAATPAIQISAACAQRNNSVQEGTVIQVNNNGALEIATANGVLTIGLAGIELLPAGQPGGPALQTLRALLENQPVLLVRDFSVQDGTGRLYRYIFTRQEFVNQALVRQGLAVMDPGSQSQSCAADFHLAEQEARHKQQGLWMPTPVPTRTFMPFVTLDESHQPGCDCSKNNVCSDFSTHAKAQTCYNACNDYNSRLDPDRDGIACEDLP